MMNIKMSLLVTLVGLGLGEAWSQTNDDEVRDIDGNVYETIKIGGQEWFTSNLRTSRFRDGTAIPEVIDEISWSEVREAAWCWYNNDSTHEEHYGKLYNWYAMNCDKGICPVGWHVPTDLEWTILVDHLGGIKQAGREMKEEGAAYWNGPNNRGGSNSSGFTGRGGGTRYWNGIYSFLRLEGYWWTSTSTNEANARARTLSALNGIVNGFEQDKRVGFSVRCVKNEEEL